MAGASGFRLAVSSIDPALATGDLVIQSFAEEIAMLDGGKEFLDLWETVYLVGGIATGLASLGPLLRSGAKLLVKLVSVETRNQLLAMLKYALRGVKGLPRFVKGQFEIVVDFVNELGRFAGQMQELARHGAMLVKGVVEGDTIPTYYLMFRNAILESGSLEEMGVALKRIVEQGKADLAQFLERMYVMKTGTGGGFDYLTQVTSSRIFGQEEKMSCGAACLRQIAMENGVEISEEVARIEAATTINGTYIDDLMEGFEKLFPGKVLSGKVRIQENVDVGAVEYVMAKVKGPWVAQLLNPFRTNPVHTVIVDKIVDGLVYIRDPWALGKQGWGQPFGVEATIKIEDFARYWCYPGAYYISVLK